MTRGYTLLETLLALALTAVVATAVRGVVARTAATRDHAVGAADRSDAARTALWQIAADLEATLAPDPTAPPRLVATAAPATLQLAIAGDGELPQSHRVVYTAVGTRLVRRDGAVDTVVLDGLHAFRVRALDRERWRDGWDGDRLPRAIEITLAVAGDDGVERQVGTVVPVPLGAWR